jgi:tetratricopeptide (TPR) repeat protein
MTTFLLTAQTFSSRVFRNALLVCLALWLAACASGAPTLMRSDLQARRAAGHRSNEGEVLGAWLLEEMFAPGGSAGEAGTARERLLAKGTNRSGLYASLSGALWDEVHGFPKRAAEGYVATLLAAKDSEDPGAPMMAWVASHHLASLRSSVPNLWTSSATRLSPLLEKPGHLGWRAHAELVEWSTAEAFDRAELVGEAYDALVTGRMGCAKAMRLAGPFGRGTAPDRRRAFAAEKAPWPLLWPSENVRGVVPHVLSTERHQCLTKSAEKVDSGVFYAEAFFETSAPRDLLISVQGAVTVWVDELPIVERDLRSWGAWQRFGGSVHVPRGRHRILARVIGDASSMRILNLDGSASGLVTDTNAQKPYGIEGPKRLSDPNPLEPIVQATATGKPLELSATMQALSARAATFDGMAEVAAALMEPLVETKDAAAVALLFAAEFSRGDVAAPEQVRRVTERDLLTKATALDEKLWFAKASLLLDDAEQRGLVEAVEPLRTLAGEHPEVTQITEQLARLYGRLGWRAERMRTARALAERFPDDRSALGLYLSALEDDGSLAEADRIAARIKVLDPDSEIDLDRALARHDWPKAIAELKRLGARRPDRKELAARIADVLMRSGDTRKAVTLLEEAVAKNPGDAALRLRLADLAYARGDTSALRTALAAALQAGSKGTEIRDAVDLLDGASHLEPYRKDGRAIIAEFEAWEKRGKHMNGTAARVLDFATVWVHPDGSSEMLEHEIVRVQSQEAIGKESEQKPPEGLVLRLRVLKPGGAILEPEPVAGKPTLTMPHLEVGDYIEIEHITATPSDGSRGQRYRGPHWFFREPEKGYWRSEFVVISPKDQALDIETLGNVPEPSRTERGPLVERRWRVEESPPAPEEPEAPNPREFLPSVRVGWGVSLNDTLLRYVDFASNETPLDPRLQKLAREIVRGLPANDTEARAKAVYRYVGEAIQDGQESDGRRVLTGRAGSRQAAFLYLVRLLGIDAELALVKSRIAMPPKGPMSEVESFDNLVIRVGHAASSGRDAQWLTLNDKFAPYGYVPAELRGQPAIVLVPGTPRATTPTLGDADGVRIEGKATLREDGSASVEFSQSFVGRMGMGIRAVFERIPENRRRELVETRLLATSLPGARLTELRLENQKDLGAPLIMKLRADVPRFARDLGNGKLALKQPFSVDVAQVASLPERQTPLLLGSSSHVDVRFSVEVPKGLRLIGSLPEGVVRDGDRSVSVRDEKKENSFTMARVVDIPAGRVNPGKEYARFVAFAREADQLLGREIVLGP